MNPQAFPKRALVTGGTRGIGQAIAIRLAAEGYSITISGRTRPEWIGAYSRITFEAVDYLDDVSFSMFVEKVALEPGYSVLLNNAGIQVPEACTQLKDENWSRIHLINVQRPMALSRALIPFMLAHQYGRIVHVASVAALISSPGSTAYSASKSALLGMTRAMALELAPHGILVNALCPGTTATEMVDRLLDEPARNRFLRRIPLGRFARPDEIADAAWFLASEDNSYMTGQAMVVDGGTVIR